MYLLYAVPGRTPIISLSEKLTSWIRDGNYSKKYHITIHEDVHEIHENWKGEKVNSNDFNTF